MIEPQSLTSTQVRSEADFCLGGYGVPKLRFDERKIDAIADKCERSTEEKRLIDHKQIVLQRGFLTKDDLNRVAYWKSPRSAGYVKKNQPEFVEEISKFAFGARAERSRIELLTLLDGVGWPTASVILHLFHQDRYPILDFRALWSANLEVPASYDFAFWWSYAQFCRNVADRCQIDMRTLDRAMWQYSKENQPKA